MAGDPDGERNIWTRRIGATAARKWTLRRRTGENGEAVYTIKTPGDGYARGEWESRKESLHEAVRELVRLGARGTAELRPEAFRARAAWSFCGGRRS